MAKLKALPEKIDIFPVSPERWQDVETLFGPNGACAGCWCMWWRMKDEEFKESHKEGHKNGLRTLVHQGVEAGLIAYVEGFPAGWVTVAPRADYVRLSTSRILAPVDDQEVWSIPCFFIHRNYRRLGMTSRLIDAAANFARQHGGKIIEAYPYEPTGKANALSIYTGVSSTFAKMGFVEVARRSEGRPIMRKTL